jgi:uncharacterized protein (DUF1015 family)
MTSPPPSAAARISNGLSLAPFRALRPSSNGTALATRLSPPYDVITPARRAELLAADPHNIVRVILPEHADGESEYREAAQLLDSWAAAGVLAPDAQAAIYVYEMRERAGAATRGLIGAVELRAPEDGVILPHENTMAGPVADRLALMTATEADLEPIYLVYDGGGAASQVVRDADEQEPLADTTTPDGVRHRLWAVTDPDRHNAIEADLRARRALIADGHHRYATYRERQQRFAAPRGAGPWDRGLALLVDSTDYGPQVHAIHRVLGGVSLAEAGSRLAAAGAHTAALAGVDDGLQQLGHAPHFAVVLAAGDGAMLVTDPDGRLSAAAQRPDEPAALADLDVTVVHRGVIAGALAMPDDEASVGYAHDVDEALAAAKERSGIALLLRATPVAAVAAVAAAGARMPRKSTLFTPKPASGLVIRRFAEQH